jgi:uncharacterized membrane protein YedE/YeeE
MGLGLLVVLSATVFSQVAHNRKWPHALGIDNLTFAVGLVGIGCLAVGIVIQLSPQHSPGRASSDSR